MVETADSSVLAQVDAVPCPLSFAPVLAAVLAVPACQGIIPCFAARLLQHRTCLLLDTCNLLLARWHLLTRTVALAVLVPTAWVARHAPAHHVHHVLARACPSPGRNMATPRLHKGKCTSDAHWCAL
jgi:hypothetical protein